MECYWKRSIKLRARYFPSNILRSSGLDLGLTGLMMSFWIGAIDSFLALLLFIRNYSTFGVFFNCFTSAHILGGPLAHFPTLIPAFSFLASRPRSAVLFSSPQILQAPESGCQGLLATSFLLGNVGEGISVIPGPASSWRGEGRMLVNWKKESEHWWAPGILCISRFAEIKIIIDFALHFFMKDWGKKDWCGCAYSLYVCMFSFMAFRFINCNINH